MPQKSSFSDASEVLIYFDDRLDTRRSLWFCRDVLDMDAVKDKAWNIYQNDDLKADQKRAQLSALGYNGSALYKALGQKLG